MENLKNKSKDELIQIINSFKKKQNTNKNVDLQAIISSINDMIFVFDACQRFIYVNVPNNNKLYLAFESFINKKYQDVMPKYLHKQFETAFEKNRKGEYSSYEYQLEINNKNHWFIARFSPVFKDNKFNGSVAVVYDINERKKTEELVKEQNNKINSIFRSAPVGIGVVKDRIITHVNKRFCEICGYTKKELINQSAEIVYPSKEDYEYVGKEKYKQIQKFGTGVVETCFKRKDGKIINILLSSTPMDLTDLSKGVTFTALDITQQNEAEEKLISDERKFRILAEHTNDWEYWVDEKGNYKYISDACEKITGYKPSEFIENPNLLFDVLHPNYSEKIQKHYYDKDSEKLSEYSTNFIITDKKGKDHWIHHNCFPVFDENGKYIGRRGNNRDITDIKRTELKLKKQNEEYEALNEEYKLTNEDLQKAKKQAEESSKLFLNIFNTVPDPISIINASTGEYLFNNERFFKLTDYTEKETLGKTAKDINIWKDYEERTKFIELLKKTALFIILKQNSE